MNVTEPESTPTVLFVCQGSSKLGLGHVMRARTVAHALAQQVHVHMIAFGDPEILNTLLRGRGFNFEIACSENLIVEQCRATQASAVVFDTTQVSLSIVQQLKGQTQLISISPVFNSQHLMDSVFHRSISLTDELEAIRHEVTIRCGLKYVVLRETCQRIPEHIYINNLHRDPLAVAISMGGGDASNHTLALLSEISKISMPMLIWVLLGEGYSHSYHSLVDCVKKSVQHEIILAKTTDSLWRVLETCSVGILAGGITTYEAAYAGLPTINVMYSQHAPALVNELVTCGVATIAGPPVTKAIPRVGQQLLELGTHRHQLLEMHRRSRGLIDQHGAMRIATEIAKVCQQQSAGSIPIQQRQTPCTHAA